eukprot:scaffold307237_cov22-Tisochrysis_lutea.AAC.1
MAGMVPGTQQAKALAYMLMGATEQGLLQDSYPSDCTSLHQTSMCYHAHAHCLPTRTGFKSSELCSTVCPLSKVGHYFFPYKYAGNAKDMAYTYAISLPCSSARKASKATASRTVYFCVVNASSGVDHSVVNMCSKCFTSNLPLLSSCVSTAGKGTASNKGAASNMALLRMSHRFCVHAIPASQALACPSTSSRCDATRKESKLVRNIVPSIRDATHTHMYANISTLACRHKRMCMPSPLWARSALILKLLATHPEPSAKSSPSL